MHDTATADPVQAHLIVYGTKDWSDNVYPRVYDGTDNEIFQYRNNQIKINVDIVLQNKRLKNVALPQQDNDAVTKAFVSQNNGDSYSYALSMQECTSKHHSM